MVILRDSKFVLPTLSWCRMRASQNSRHHLIVSSSRDYLWVVNLTMSLSSINATLRDYLDSFGVSHSTKFGREATQIANEDDQSVACVADSFVHCWKMRDRLVPILEE